MQCIFPKSRTVLILVSFLDDSKQFFKVSIKQKGIEILLSVTKSIPVENKEYFGLRYYDKYQKSHWINLDKSVYQQLKKSQIERNDSLSTDSYYHIEFEVRYYPRDPTSVGDENFRYQIFLQIRKDLTSMKLVIKDESILSVLCGLILQSDFGDYSDNRFAPHYIRQTISPHLLNPFLEDKIKSEHIKLSGVEPIEAEYRFLEKIRWLENYGTIIFPVKDSNNKYCFFGLNPQGFSFRYQMESNLNHDIFWPRVSAIKRKGRQIIIKEKGDTTIKHSFETGEKALCVHLYKISLNHFAFFKSKKDDKPLVSEPPKRQFGRSSSKEFGYSSDTSDYNQYSDDTFSSYPDSINTTQSSKTTKAFKKTNVSTRNCISDVEESVLSRKNRRVIVSKSQTETEDEGFKPYDYQMKANTFDLGISETDKRPAITHSQSYDRIPPDYIYENRISKAIESSNEQAKVKRIRKRIPSQAYIERSNRNHKYINRNDGISHNTAHIEKKYSNPAVDYRINESEIRRNITQSGDLVDTKNRVPRKLPTPNVILQNSKLMYNPDYSTSNYQINQSASVDSILNIKRNENRTSPTKRMLPNIATVASTNSAFNPPIPRHRIQPKYSSTPDNMIKSQLNAGFSYKPGYVKTPQVPQHSTIVHRKPNNDFSKDNIPTRIYRKPVSNNRSKPLPESGI